MDQGGVGQHGPIQANGEGGGLLPPAAQPLPHSAHISFALPLSSRSQPSPPRAPAHTPCSICARRPPQRPSRCWAPRRSAPRRARAPATARPPPPAPPAVRHRQPLHSLRTAPRTYPRLAPRRRAAAVRAYGTQLRSASRARRRSRTTSAAPGAPGEGPGEREGGEEISPRELMILFGHVARARRLWGGAGEKEGGEEISPQDEYNE